MPAEPAASPPPLVVHVHPAGRDDGAGPFATLLRARDAVREARAGGHHGPVTVRLHAGVYQLTEPLVLRPQDGGPDEDASVVWEAAAGQQVVLDGGRALQAWRRLEKDAARAAGLPAEAVPHVWVADTEPGWHFSRLFWDGKALPRAVSTTTEDWRAWPIGQLGSPPDETLVVPAGAVPPGEDGGNADLNFMPTPYTRWSNAVVPVRGIDPDTRTVSFVPMRLPRPDRTKDIPFRLENVASGLAEAGRWYLDSRRGRLYLWPPEDAPPDEHEVRAPFLETLVSVVGSAGDPVRHLVLRGLELRHARIERPAKHAGFESGSAALTLDGVEDCSLDDLRFSALEGWAVRGGPAVRSTSVRRCSIEDAGGGGIRLRGRGGLDPSPCTGNRIVDNTVTRIGRLHWHSAAIALGAAEGNLVAHNLVYDLPYIGIAVGGGPRHTYFRGWPRPFPELERLWREHGEGEPTIDAVKRFIPGHNRIEYNIIHHAMQVLDDGAAIYCHAGHHETMKGNVVYGLAGHGRMALYFDDEQMDSVMEGNLVYGCDDVIAVHLHHNGRHRVVNNVLVGVRQLLSVPNGYGGHQIERNVFVWDGEPNWDRADPGPASGPGDGRRQKGWDAGPSVARSNLWWSTAGPAEAARLLTTWRGRGYGQGSAAADPLFVDPGAGNYRLEAASPAFGLGFVPLEIDNAGPRRP